MAREGRGARGRRPSDGRPGRSAYVGRESGCGTYAGGKGPRQIFRSTVNRHDDRCWSHTAAGVYLSPYLSPYRSRPRRPTAVPFAHRNQRGTCGSPRPESGMRYHNILWFRRLQAHILWCCLNPRRVIASPEDVRHAYITGADDPYGKRAASRPHLNRAGSSGAVLERDRRPTRTMLPSAAVGGRAERRQPWATWRAEASFCFLVGRGRLTSAERIRALRDGTPPAP